MFRPTMVVTILLVISTSLYEIASIIAGAYNIS